MNSLMFFGFDMERKINASEFLPCIQSVVMISIPTSDRFDENGTCSCSKTRDSIRLLSILHSDFLFFFFFFASHRHLLVIVVVVVVETLETLLSPILILSSMEKKRKKKERKQDKWQRWFQVAWWHVLSLFFWRSLAILIGLFSIRTYFLYYPSSFLLIVRIRIFLIDQKEQAEDMRSSKSSFLPKQRIRICRSVTIQDASPAGEHPSSSIDRIASITDINNDEG